MGDTSYNLVSMIGIEDIGSPEVWFGLGNASGHSWMIWEGLEGSEGPGEWVRVEPEK